MAFAPRAMLAGALGLAVSFVVACGGGAGLLSSDQANNLTSQLDQASSALGAGQCGAADAAVNSFSTAVQNLPPSVNRKLADSLRQDADTVASLTRKDCREHTSSTAKTNTVTTATTPTRTTTPATTPTSTTSTSRTTPSPATPHHGQGNNQTGPGSGGAGLTGGGGGSGGGNGSGGAGSNGNGNGE